MMKKKTIVIILLMLNIFAYGQKIRIKENIKFQSLFKFDRKEKNSCYRIPAIISAPNGDLIAVADQRNGSCGDLKYNDNINIVIRRSENNGKTWSEIKTIVDYPQGESASDPSLIVDKQTNCVFLFYNYMNLNTEKNVFYFRCIKSYDNGKTWSKAEDITSQIGKTDWHNDFKFITSGRGMQTNEGVLVHTLVNINKGLYVFYSDNHGKTWQLKDNAIKYGDESKIIELPDNSWLVNSRVNGLGCRFVHVSDNKGDTWRSNADPSLIDPSCNASIINYNIYKNKQVLLFCNLNSKDTRENLCLKISYDSGKTWEHLAIIYKNSAAYSSMTILPNGDIGVLFEKDDYQEIAFAVLKVKKKMCFRGE